MALLSVVAPPLLYLCSMCSLPGSTSATLSGGGGYSAMLYGGAGLHSNALWRRPGCMVNYSGGEAAALQSTGGCSAVFMYLVYLVV